MKSSFEKSKGSKATSRALQDILQKWLITQSRYAGKVKGDYSWNYRERTCIGFLAAATWLSGGVALEEWKTEKKKGRHTCYGRCDLWIRHMRTDFFIEAKHSHVAFQHGRHNDAVSYLKKRLRVAVKDAKKQPVDCSSRVKRLGVLFVGAKFYSKDAESLTRTRAAGLKKLYDLPHSAMAWLFEPPQSKKKPRRSCGIIVIAKEVK
jgi:hypothetical protein